MGGKGGARGSERSAARERRVVRLREEQEREAVHTVSDMANPRTPAHTPLLTVRPVSQREECMRRASVPAPALPTPGRAPSHLLAERRVDCVDAEGHPSLVGDHVQQVLVHRGPGPVRDRAGLEGFAAARRLSRHNGGCCACLANFSAVDQLDVIDRPLLLLNTRGGLLVSPRVDA